MKLSGIKILGLFALAALITISCKKEDQMEIDQELIQNFILEHELDAQSTESGLHYVIFEPGSEERPSLTDEITISYIGFLLNGDVFDSGDITYPLNGFILGWQEGIRLFGKDGRGLLIIPSHLAYGNTIKNGIPPNSVLVFEIHLTDF